jgi:hypothetical protein
MRILKAALLLSAFALPHAAPAATTLIDVVDAKGYDAPQRSPLNSIIRQQIAPGAWIRAIDYSVTITAKDVSLSGPVAWFGSSDDYYAQFRPDGDVWEEGTKTYTGKINLSGIGSDFRLGADGLLILQIGDTDVQYFNTDDVQYSTTWNGWFKVDYDSVAAVPEPATWTMALLGFGLLGATLRTRGTRLTMRNA